MGGNRYFFLIVDDYSRYIWIYVIEIKDEAFSSFKNFKARFESESSLKLKALRTDRGGEFVSKQFVDFFDKKGIKR